MEGVQARLIFNVVSWVTIRESAPSWLWSPGTDQFIPPILNQNLLRSIEQLQLLLVGVVQAKAPVGANEVGVNRQQAEEPPEFTRCVTSQKLDT